METRKPKGHPREVSARQRLFVESYLADGDATAAALKAGYCRTQAAKEGRRLRRLPQVGEAIAAGLRAKALRERVNESQVRQELARIAFADISDFLSWDDEGVHLRPMDELTADQTACVAEIVEGAGKAGKTLRVKLHGKLAALAALSRLFGGETREAGAGARQIVVVTAVPEPFALPDPEHPETAGWPPPEGGDHGDPA